MKEFLLNLIRSDSPESSRRVVVFALTINFIAIIWYVLTRTVPLENKEIIILCIEATVAIIGGGWITISAEKFAKKKVNGTEDPKPPTE